MTTTKKKPSLNNVHGNWKIGKSVPETKNKNQSQTASVFGIDAQ